MDNGEDFNSDSGEYNWDSDSYSINYDSDSFYEEFV